MGVLAFWLPFVDGCLGFPFALSLDGCLGFLVAFSLLAVHGCLGFLLSMGVLVFCCLGFLSVFLVFVVFCCDSGFLVGHVCDISADFWQYSVWNFLPL